jgi:putative aldouronate transport system substrate-binding protein
MRRLLLVLILILALVVSACSQAAETTEPAQEEQPQSTELTETEKQAEADKLAAEEAAAKAQAELEAAKAAEEQAKADAQKAAEEKAEAEKLLAEAKTEEEKIAAQKLLADKVAAEAAATQAAAKAAAEKASVEKAVAAEKAAAQAAAKATAEKIAAEKAAALKEKFNPLGKYNPSIEVTMPRYTRSTTIYADKQDMFQNIRYSLLQQDLGINMKTTWVVDQSQYKEKVNVMIASGDLPDVMLVDKQTMSKLARAGLIEDLTDHYKNYASQLLVDSLEGEGRWALDSSSYEGKLMGIPSVQLGIGATSTQLFIRSDWLKKLNIAEPKTIQDVIKIANAFTNQDPDGDGKKDTVGLGLRKDLFSFQSYLPIRNSGIGFVNGYHAYPGIWIKDKEGKLVYGSVQPEMRNALSQMRDMFAAGLIDREFAVKNDQQFIQDISTGKVGMFFGGQGNPIAFLQPHIKNEPNAEWKIFPIFSADNKLALVGSPLVVEEMLVVKKGYKHPEAAVKLANHYINTFDKYLSGDQKLWDLYQTQTTPQGPKQVWQFAPYNTNDAKKNTKIHLKFVDIFVNGNKDKYKLNSEEKNYYDAIIKWNESKDSAGYGFAYVFGPEGTHKVINAYYQKNQFKFNEFTGSATDTMISRGASLQTLEDETFFKIIMGAPLETFDKFVSDWKALGGDQITAEVNAWAKSKK